MSDQTSVPLRRPMACRSTSCSRPGDLGQLAVDVCDITTGEVVYVRARGRAELRPVDRQRALRKFARYLGQEQAKWDPRFVASLDDPTSRMARMSSQRPSRQATCHSSSMASLPGSRRPGQSTPSSFDGAPAQHHCSSRQGRRGCGQAVVRWAITSVFSSVHSTSPGRTEAMKHSSASASSTSP